LIDYFACVHRVSVFDFVGAFPFHYIGSLSDKAYKFWATYRLKMTGRPSLDVLIKEKAEAKHKTK
jgi:predicted DCC family thiol-disulfide oxidoreductase YuxK